MTYSIKTVAEKFGLTISTIRYYDKKGLLPFVSKDAAGNRAFTDADMNLIYTICCLKNTGMTIKQIKTYIDDVMAGEATIDDRIALLNEHRQEILRQQQVLVQSLGEIDNKLAKYQASDAHERIRQEVAFVNREKKRAGLPAAFDVATH